MTIRKPLVYVGGEVVELPEDDIADQVGIPGEQGEQGPVGPQGPQGEVGPEGPQGIQGEEGTGLVILGSQDDPSELPPTGNTVGDAYLISGNLWVWDGDSWEDAGNVQGPTGPQGPEGPPGPQGIQGIQGIQGPQGEVGPQGIQGPEGPAGDQGPEGPEGPAGPQGEKGDTGDTGPAGPGSGDMLKSENLSGLVNYSTARTNLGLGNVDNTSDVNKPVSAAQAAADAVVLDSANDYADSLVTGLWDDRGSFDASVNTYPTTGGSGAAGAILKGDIWTISVVATAGPLLGLAIGTTVRALGNTPAQTVANWAVASVGLGYVPENAANKDVSGGYAGLTLLKLNLKNVAGTVTSWFTTAATVARTWTMPDKDGTVAMLSDITWTAPDGIGTTTPNSGAFTTLSASSLALGVTPSAWSGFTAFDIGNTGALYFNSGNASAGFGNNLYYNGTNWIYKTTAAATLYTQNAGVHQWYSVASGTAGASATLVERLRVADAGQIGLGGANYGTSGQVLVSGGPSAAPAWGDVGTDGTWTPGLGAFLGGGDPGFFDGSVAGNWARAGKLITVDFEIAITTISAFGGAAVIATNLPAPATGTLPQGTLWWNGAISNIAYGSVVGSRTGSNLEISLWGLAAPGTSLGPLSSTQIGNGTSLRGSLTYRAA